MNPYYLQRYCESYLEDSTMRPLIRRAINSAITFVCTQNEPGKDWSFMVNDNAEFSVHYDSSDALVGLAYLPVGVRSVINIYEGPDFKAHIHGRTIVVECRPGLHPASRPSSLRARVYRAPVPLSANPTNKTDMDTEWTPDNPPDSDIFLPDEATDLVCFRALQILGVVEIEVANNIQSLQSLISEQLATLRANYSIQIDTRVPVDETKEHNESLTAGWLVNYGATLVGGERDTYQLLRLVNVAASNIADWLKLKGAQRPKPVYKLTDPLPDFGKPSGANMSGDPNGDRSLIPAAYWEAAMNYVCLKHIKQLEKFNFEEYQQTMAALSDLFYSLRDKGQTDIYTYGGMMNHLRTLWKNQRGDAFLWSSLNRAIADVMRQINVQFTQQLYDFSPRVCGVKSVNLPYHIKHIVRIMINGRRVICRGAEQRGRVRPEQGVWGFPDAPHSFSHMVASVRGRSVEFSHPLPVGCKLEIAYYPMHVWPSYSDPDTADMLIPVDPSLVLTRVEADIALESGNGSKYKALMDIFMQQLQAYDETQNVNLADDDRIIAAVPPVDYLLDVNTGCWLNY